MAKLFNRARMTTATTGTGTITLGAAVSNAFLTFAEAGVANADVVAYCIEDGTDFESGIGTYTSAGTTLSRTTVRNSKIGGTAGTSKINLSGTATVFLSPAKEDLLSISETVSASQVLAGPVSGAAAAPTFRVLTMPTRQYLLSGTGATYTTPAGCQKIIAKYVGGGGGGGAQATNNGANGTGTTFNSITANPGSGGVTAAGAGGAGGTGGAGSANFRLDGANGSRGEGPPFSGNSVGGDGGSSVFGGAGPGGFNSVGLPGKANTGGGGGGAGGTNVANNAGGGGTGEYVELIIASPAGTYTFTVGPGGNGGAAGGIAGGNGGSGVIIVEEYY